MNRRELGNAGEKVAQQFLKKRGYKVIETNYRCRAGELDIVAEKKGYTVFVEVRTRGSQEFGGPEESLTSAKKERLVRLALGYLQEHPGAKPDWRIDVVAIDMDKGKTTRIELIENAVTG